MDFSSLRSQFSSFTPLTMQQRVPLFSQLEDTSPASAPNFPASGRSIRGSAPSGTRVPQSVPVFPWSGARVPRSTSLSPFAGIRAPAPHLPEKYKNQLPASPQVPSPAPSLASLLSQYGSSQVPSTAPSIASLLSQHESPQVPSPVPSIASLLPHYGSPRVPSPAPSIASLLSLSQDESPQVPCPAPTIASLLPQHGRVENIPVSSFPPAVINIESLGKKMRLEQIELSNSYRTQVFEAGGSSSQQARVFETGASSNPWASVFKAGGGSNPEVSTESPYAEQLKAVTEFSQLLDEISIPTHMAYDLIEDRLLVNSYTPIDHMRETCYTVNCNTANNSEIDEMNNWWDKYYNHDIGK